MIVVEHQLIIESEERIFLNFLEWPMTSNDCHEKISKPPHRRRRADGHATEKAAIIVPFAVP